MYYIHGSCFIRKQIGSGVEPDHLCSAKTTLACLSRACQAIANSLRSKSCFTPVSRARGRRKGGKDPLDFDIWYFPNFQQKKSCFLSFEGVKLNFNTFGLTPGKIHCSLSSWKKILPTPMPVLPAYPAKKSASHFVFLIVPRWRAPRCTRALEKA